VENSFRVLAAARAVVDEVNGLLRGSQHSLIHRSQLRDSVQSIPANIREGIGRQAGPDRKKSYRVARGSAEEADEHLRANYAEGRIPPSIYWRLHNRLIVIVKMLNALCGGA
jgi:four helix bundle protein